MNSYSLVKNLKFMIMIFYQPKLLIDQYINKKSILYGIVPTIISEILYFVLGIITLINPVKSTFSINPLIRFIPLNYQQLAILRIITHPLQAVTTVLIFIGVAYLILRIIKIKELSVFILISAFLFIFGTISILAAFIDYFWLFPPPGWNLDFLSYFHPIAGIGGMLFLILLVHKYLKINYLLSFFVIFPSVILASLSRILFIP